jgi:hypothetical protein
MILLFIISCLILALIIFAIFFFSNYKTYNKYYIIKHIENCKSPTIIGLSKNGIYTNIINSPKDKIIISFISDDNINATYLNSTTFQLIDKDNVSIILKYDNLKFISLFYFLYNIYIFSPYRISSLISKNTYIFNKEQAGFFYNEFGYYIVSSLNPLIIHSINNLNFDIISEYMNIKWNDINIHINSNPILINGLYWIIGTNENKLYFIVFDFVKKNIIDLFNYNLNNIDEISYGLIFNNYNNTFIIPIIKNNKIQILNINKNELNKI